jgi:hypothetical protein
MSGSLTVGGSAGIAYFTEVVPGTATLRLAAAVASRGTPTPEALCGGGGPLGWPRSVRHRLWLRLGPWGADVSVAGRPLFGGASGAARSAVCVGVIAHPEPLAYFDDGTHELRVLGRVVSAPRTRTLVALIDAAGRRASAPRLVLRLVPTPAIPMPHFDDAPLEEDATVSHVMGGEQSAWETALRADSGVRDFLDE